MSSSGLIYAVIVGAWAAYLVPMWLRRQDELNEARPTERFSTAIRLLSGKAAMERRYAKEAERRSTEDPGARDDFDENASTPGESVGDADESVPDTAEDAVDVRAFADPKTMARASSSEAPTEIVAPSVSAEASASAASSRGDAGRPDSGRPSPDRAGGGSKAARVKEANRNKRAKLLARRRRTTMVLFLAFTLGSVVAAVGGFAFLWAPAVPAALLSGYIVHLRGKERRRFVVTMDRRRAEAAATRLHERRRRPAAGRSSPETQESGADRVQEVGHPPRKYDERGAADRRALVEQTDHAEWIDQQRARHHEQPEGEGWDPVPVPLPTYVSAPVAPRRTRNVDLEAPDTWSSARSSTVGGAEPQQPPHASQAPHSQQSPASETGTGPRHGPDRNRTPLFDQYEDEERPRAANE